MDFSFFQNLNLPQIFEEQYRCYPASFAEKAHIEDGDKILLPPSALEVLARLHVNYPMLFRLENEALRRYTHCGVLEFSATEGCCYLPYWMMQNLFLQEGAIITVKNVSLPKATFVKFRPQDAQFLQLTNPKAVLEASLRKFSCLTIGDTISLQYNNKNYLIDVIEVRPTEGACIIETDCEVQFDEPVDHVAPSVPKKEERKEDTSLPYGGIPTVSKATSIAKESMKPLRGLKLNKANNGNSAEEIRAARMRKYEAYHGTGYSLSGTTTASENRCISTAPRQEEKTVITGMTLKGKKTTIQRNETTTTAMETKPTITPFSGEGKRLR